MYFSSFFSNAKALIWRISNACPITLRDWAYDLVADVIKTDPKLVRKAIRLPKAQMENREFPALNCQSICGNSALCDIAVFSLSRRADSNARPTSQLAAQGVTNVCVHLR